MSLQGSLHFSCVNNYKYKLYFSWIFCRQILRLIYGGIISNNVLLLCYCIIYVPAQPSLVKAKTESTSSCMFRFLFEFEFIDMFIWK